MLSPVTISTTNIFLVTIRIERLLELFGQPIGGVGPLPAPVEEDGADAVDGDAPDGIVGGIGQKGFHVGHRVLREVELELPPAGQAVVVLVAAVAVFLFLFRFVVLFRISLFLRTPVTSAQLFLLLRSFF